MRTNLQSYFFLNLAGLVWNLHRRSSINTKRLLSTIQCLKRVNSCTTRIWHFVECMIIWQLNRCKATVSWSWTAPFPLICLTSQHINAFWLHFIVSLARVLRAGRSCSGSCIVSQFASCCTKWRARLARQLLWITMYCCYNQQKPSVSLRCSPWALWQTLKILCK